MYDLRLCPTIHYGNTDFTRTGDRTPLYGLLKSEDFTGRFLLIGEGSIGKTTSLRMLEAELMLEDRPCVLFELKKLNMDASGLSMPASDEFPKGTVVLLDGWDELRGGQRETAENVSRLYLHNKNVAAVVLSSRSRPGEDGMGKDDRISRIFADFRQADVMPYTDEQLKGLLEAFGIEPDVMEKPVGTLLRNTMMLSMFIEMTRKDSGRMTGLAEVGLEAPFLLAYFEQLYGYRSGSIYHDDDAGRCENDLSRIGKWIMCEETNKPAPEDLGRGIANELTSMFAVTEGKVVSSHVKYRGLAAAVYMKLKVDDGEYKSVIEMLTTKHYLPIEIPTYLGQMYADCGEHPFIGEVDKALISGLSDENDKGSYSSCHWRTCVQLMVGYRKGVLVWSDAWCQNALYHECYSNNPYLICSTHSEQHTEKPYMRISDDIQCIHERAFSQCVNLAEIYIPDGVEKIVTDAFSNCTGLQKVRIPDSVTEIGDLVFNGCTNLREINIPNALKTINCGVFRDCTSLTAVDLPDSVTEIQYGAFANCQCLQKIRISNNVTTIGGSVFFNCTGLLSIRIPNSVTEVGDSVFYGCTNLREVYISKKEKHIGRFTFCNCISLLTIRIPNGIVSIGNRAFCGCKSLKTIEIPDSVITIGDGTFFRCTNLQEIHIPDSVKQIGDEAFDGCTELQVLHIPDTVEWIGDEAFRGCTNLHEIGLSNSITEIGDYTFAFCRNIQRIIIPSQVEEIGEGAFWGCEGLKEISIPNCIKRIRENAFNECTGLQIIHIITPIKLHFNNKYYQFIKKHIIINSTGKVIIDANPK